MSQLIPDIPAHGGDPPRAAGEFGRRRDLRLRVEAPPIDVVDTIGAGDAFGAALLAQLHNHDAVRPDPSLEEDELKATLADASLGASLTCTRAGDDPPTRSQMRELSG